MNDYFNTAVAEPVKRTRKVSGDTLRNSDGVMRAYTYVEATDIFGRMIRRRVSLGTDWNTELESARNTIERVRANNQGLVVCGDFRVNL